MKNQLKNYCGKAVIGVSTLAGSAMALAVDHTAAIEAAGTAGQSNLTAAVTTVIGIVAVVVGAGLVIGFLKRS